MVKTLSSQCLQEFNAFISMTWIVQVHTVGEGKKWRTRMKNWVPSCTLPTLKSTHLLHILVSCRVVADVMEKFMRFVLVELLEFPALPIMTSRGHSKRHYWREKKKKKKT